MNARRIVGATVAAVLVGGAIFDIGLLVPIKAGVVGLLPISDEQKAATIRSLCDRAYLDNGNAGFRCYSEYASESLRDASAAYYRSEQAKRNLCNRADRAFADGVPAGLVKGHEDHTFFAADAGEVLQYSSGSGYMATFDRAKDTILLVKGIDPDTIIFIECAAY